MVNYSMLQKSIFSKFHHFHIKNNDHDYKQYAHHCIPFRKTMIITAVITKRQTFSNCKEPIHKIHDNSKVIKRPFKTNQIFAKKQQVKIFYCAIHFFVTCRLTQSGRPEMGFYVNPNQYITYSSFVKASLCLGPMHGVASVFNK